MFARLKALRQRLLKLKAEIEHDIAILRRPVPSTEELMQALRKNPPTYAIPIWPEPDPRDKPN